MNYHNGDGSDFNLTAIPAKRYQLSGLLMAFLWKKLESEHFQTTMSHSFNKTGWCSGWKTLSVSPYFCLLSKRRVLCFYSTLCDGRKRLHVPVCARCERVFEWAKEEWKLFGRFFVFLHDGLSVQCAALHYEFNHTLGSAIIPWYEVPACTWPSFTFPLRVEVLSFTLIMLSRCLVAQSIQRVSEWVKLKAFSHKSCRGDDSSHMPARSFMQRSHHKN